MLRIEILALPFLAAAVSGGTLAGTVATLAAPFRAVLSALGG